MTSSPIETRKPIYTVSQEHAATENQPLSVVLDRLLKSFYPSKVLGKDKCQSNFAVEPEATSNPASVSENVISTSSFCLFMRGSIM